MTGRTSQGFVWHELRTTEPAKAVEFYSALFDWTATERDHGTEFSAGGYAVGGVIQVEPAEAPAWDSYLHVDDLDAALESAQAAGAHPLRGPETSAGPAGRTAGVLHPLAGGLVLFEGELPAAPPVPRGRPHPNGFGWHQLDTPQPTEAVRFFAAFVGWGARPTALEDMTVLRANGSVDLATVSTAPSGVPAHWLPFVAVENLGEILRRATELGALVVVEQTLLPPVGPVCVLRDHDGVTIACFEIADS